jgi:diacylglycerol kinase family enzyme
MGAPALETDMVNKTSAHRRAIVVVNASAGEVLQVGKQQFSALIREGLDRAGLSAEVRAVRAPDLDATLKAALDARPDLVIVAGGDGTISRLLPTLLDARCAVAVLPLGTLNLLARDLGMSMDLQANLAFIATQGSRPIDLGEVNGRPFHSNAGLGFFSMMAREREIARKRFPFSKALGFAFAALRTTLFSKTITVELEVAGQSVMLATDAVLVTNNRFAGTPWRRASIDEGLLEVHTLQAPGVLARLRAAIAVARGNWRDLPSLTSFTAPSVSLTRRGRTRALVAIDGEIHRLANPLRFTVRRAALRLPLVTTSPTDANG